MSTEQQEQQLTQEQIDEQEAQAFAAGFDGTRGNAPVIEQPKPAAVVEAPAATPAADVPADSAQHQDTLATEAAPVMIAGMTEDQVRALLAKAQEVDGLREELNRTRDTIFGRFGEVNRNLQSLQKPTPAQAGAGGKLTKEVLKRTAEVLGEDVADALASDLSGVAPGAAPAAQPGDLEEQFNSHAAALERNLELKFERKNLLRQHKDFYEQIETPDFKLWLGQQTPDMQKQFGETIDSDWLAGQMSTFKSHQESAKQQRQQEQERQLQLQQQQQNKKQLLEEAVAPRGTPAATPAGLSDDEAFEAGFKTVRGTK